MAGAANATRLPRAPAPRRSPWRTRSSPVSFCYARANRGEGADTMSAATANWAAGAAYIDGRFMPVAEAMIPVTDWGYRRSDVTYDVVSVWDGAFFKLDDHLKRFRNSMQHFRLQPRETDDDIRGILQE